MNREIENFLACHPYAEETRKKYRPVLLQLIKLDLDHLDADGLLSFIKRPNWGTSQRHLALCACRKYIRWKYGQHPALEARIKTGRPKKQRSVNIEKAMTILASFDTQTPQGNRDLAISMLLLDTGLRVSEVSRIDIENVDFNPVKHPITGILVCTLQTIIKGGNWDQAVFSMQTAAQLQTWLLYRKAIPGEKALFTSMRTGRRLTADGIQMLYKYLSRKIGIEVSPHDFRRGWAELVSLYGSPEVVTQHAGRWKDTRMVSHYTRNLKQLLIAPYLPISNLLKID